MDVYKICLIAAGAAIVVTLLKTLRKEFALLTAISAGIVLLVFAAGELAPFFSYVGELCSGSGYSEYFAVLIKAVGVGLIGAICGELCRDVGENSLAMKLDLCVKGALMVLSLPLFRELFGYLEAYTA